MLKNKGGFTLIELVMIIIILGILAAVAIPKYQDLRTEAENGADDGVMGAARSGPQIYFAKYRDWPTKFSSIFDTLPTDWTTNAGDDIMTCPTAHKSPQVTITLTGGGATPTIVTRAGGTAGGRH